VEEEIKSALEIAMERISGLPQLTPEEIVEQKEKEYKPIGETLCQKYLEGKMTENELSSEVDKRPSVQGRIIRRALILSLSRSIQLEDPIIAGRALKGLTQVGVQDKGFCEDAGRRLDQIFGDFLQDKNARSREFENLSRERIQNLGVSGSAVRPNLVADESLQAELARIRQAYEPRLEELRNMLLQKLQMV
jgi:hypothetical protein